MRATLKKSSIQRWAQRRWKNFIIAHRHVRWLFLSQLKSFLSCWFDDGVELLWQNIRMIKRKKKNRSEMKGAKRKISLLCSCFILEIYIFQLFLCCFSSFFRTSNPKCWWWKRRNNDETSYFKIHLFWLRTWNVVVNLMLSSNFTEKLLSWKKEIIST